MSEKAARRSSLTLFEVGIILLIAVGLGAYVMHRAKEARRRAVAGVLKAAGAKIQYGKDESIIAIDMTAIIDSSLPY